MDTVTPSCYVSVMKWNVNPATLLSETTEKESQTPFNAALIIFFWEFPE